MARIVPQIRWSLLLFLQVSAGFQAQDKPPSPTPAEQSEVEKLIKDVFKEEYSKRALPDRQALAQKLLEQGRDSKDDLKYQFVLLREARDIAAQAGDPSTSIAAVDEIAKRFAIDAPEMKLAAIAMAAKTAKTPEELRAVIAALLRLVDAALAADDYGLAERYSGAGLQQARKSQDPALVNRVTAKSREIVDLKARFEKLRKAREILTTDPEDAASNLLLGRFLCLVKGDWENGLPHLAKSLDPAFGTVAKKDVANPTETDKQLAVGDGWWDLSEKEPSPGKEQLKIRAGVWYGPLMSALTGVNKTRIDRRLAECRVAQILKGSWVDFTDPKLFGASGKPGDPVEAACKPGQITTLKMQFPKGDYDGCSARILIDPMKDCTIFFIYEGPNSSAILLDTPRAFLSNARGNGSGWNPDYTDNWTKAAETFITLVLVNGEYLLYINGVEKTRIKTRRTRIEYLGLEARNSPAKFDQIKLRRAE